VVAETHKLANKKGMAKITVQSFDNLLMDFVNDCGADIIVRGLRAVSDFEYEFQMAGMNAKLDDSVETIFLMASDKYQLISSRFVKEIAMLGGDVRHFVSPGVHNAMKKEFKKSA